MRAAGSAPTWTGLAVAVHQVRTWLKTSGRLAAAPAVAHAPAPAAARRSRAGSSPTAAADADCITVASDSAAMDEGAAGDGPDQDTHDDYCAVCDVGGELLMCDSCPRVYHLACHDPPLRHVPRFAWVCGTCVRPRPFVRIPRMC